MNNTIMQTQFNKGQNIFNFKKGDLIIQTTPNVHGDTTFMNQPFELICIKNSQIILESKKGYFLDKRFEASLHHYSENWIKYQKLTSDENLNFKDYVSNLIRIWFFDEELGFVPTEDNIKRFLHKLYISDNSLLTKEQIEEILKD